MTTGTLAGVGAAWLTQMTPAIALGFVAVTTVCALLPDMDHPDATAPRYFGWPGQVVAWAIGGLFGHRGLTHSILGIGILTVALAFVPGVPGWVAAGIVFGCCVHVVGDMCTVSGVPLLWPLDRRFRIGVMQTGGFFETVILYPVLVAVTVLAAGGVAFGALT